MENYSGVEIINSGWNSASINYDPACCGRSAYYNEHSLIVTVKNAINWLLLTILVVGLIIISFLIYRKHKGEKGLWKKILKWDLIFFFIIVVVWLILGFLLWYPRDPVQPVAI